MKGGHVAVIMDGNGRWAGERRLPRLEGHRRGVRAVREAIEGAVEAGLGYLTLYAFSVENWKRPKDEVKGLMELLGKMLENELEELKKKNIRLRAIGRLGDLPAGVRKILDNAIEQTEKNSGLNLVLALSYSSRVEMTEAVREIVKKYQNGEIKRIDETVIRRHLYTHDIPDPDLLIRTSGEMRLSNFLLWQCSYTEFYVTPVLWPDFRKKDFLKAIEEFKKRERRFGGVKANAKT